MCGIFGFTGRVDNAHALLTSLFLANRERGTDSAGLAAVTKDKAEVIKMAVDPREFVQENSFRKMANRKDVVTFLGHTRWATRGAISDSNAHPFISGRTVGIHNGTVNNFSTFKGFTGKRWSNDSRHLIYSLNKYGHVGPATGSINLAWCDLRNDVDLNLVRSGSTLHYAITVDNQAVIFSSDESHLIDALQIAGIFNYHLVSVWSFSKVVIKRTACGQLSVEEFTASDILPEVTHKKKTQTPIKVEKSYSEKNYSDDWYDFERDSYGDIAYGQIEDNPYPDNLEKLEEEGRIKCRVS